MLNRSEQCRFRLQRKLAAKDYPPEEIRAALDELEAEGLLSDRRFAIAWMRNRAIQKHEGASKLLAGLLERGIEHAVARDALDEFFAETPESLCCQQAVAKYHRVGAAHKAPLAAHLKRLGFTMPVIRGAVSSQPALESD